MKLIGSGAQGEVWEAIHKALGQRVALKIVNDPSLIKEAVLLRELDHPNVIRVYDVEVRSSKPYIAMELGEGSLRDRLGPLGDVKPLPLREGLELFRNLSFGPRLRGL